MFVNVRATYLFSTYNATTALLRVMVYEIENAITAKNCLSWLVVSQKFSVVTTAYVVRKTLAIMLQCTQVSSQLEKLILGVFLSVLYVICFIAFLLNKNLKLKPLQLVSTYWDRQAVIFIQTESY